MRTNEKFIFCKKIIATTDTSLKVIKLSNLGENWKDISLPQPSQEFIQYFIEEYNKGNIITDVLVEYDDLHKDYDEMGLYNPNISIQLKVNSDNTINIKSIKDSWNKEEVDLEKSEFIHLFFSHHYTELSNKGITSEYIRKWIEENL